MPFRISESDLYAALRQVRHPEFEMRNLVELGMVQQIELVGDRVSIRLAMPLPNSPIEQKLIALIHEAITQADNHLQVQVTPVPMQPEQRAAFMNHVRGNEPPAALKQIGHVVAVMSGKGGVGKSSVAGLLASSLRREGLQIGILDADITGPSIPKMFGVHHAPQSGPDGMLPVESRTGIKLMSINLLLTDESQAVVWRGPLIGRAIEQFWRDTAWGKLDYLIVDLPPGTSDAALTVAQQLPLRGILLVTSPQDLAGMVVRKTADMAIQLGVPLIGLVENMSYVTCPACDARIDVFGPSQAAETARRIGTRLLGQMPLDSELAVLCDAGLVEDYHCDAFSDIAKEVRDFVLTSEVRAP